MTLKYQARKSVGYEILDLTSLTLEEFEILVVPFEQQFQAHMAEWRMDGKRREKRRYTTYRNCPLPSAEDRLLFILVYMKNQSLQVTQGQLFGMPQCKANIWIHLLLLVLQKTLCALGDTPSRNLTDLAQHLGVSLEQASEWLSVQEQAATNSPLFATMAPSDPFYAHRLPWNNRKTTVVRKNVIP